MGKRKGVGGFDAHELFDMEDSGPAPEPSANDRLYRAFEQIPRWATFAIGAARKEYLVVHDNGSVKVCTVYGTAGRKMYEVTLVSLNPFTVAAYEITEGGAGRLQTPEAPPGTPRVTGMTEEVSVPRPRGGFHQERRKK